MTRMDRAPKFKRSAHATVVLMILVPLAAVAESKSTPAEAIHVSTTALWRDRNDIRALDLVSGPGGRQHQPSGKFTFVQEDLHGSSPKFDVVDQQGFRWEAKLGPESKAETAATRIVWAAGYFSDEDYYVPEMHVDKLGQLHRGGKFVSADGIVRGVRLEHHPIGEKKTGNWSWFDNPFEGTRELNGLKVLMALINNWDLKEINNEIYMEAGEEIRYVVSDLGASFGRTGNTWTRSKNNLSDFRQAKFIQHVGPEDVDFVLKSRPLFFMALRRSYYAEHTEMERIVKHIPREHARWIGEILARLSTEQIRECFRAAGYSPEEVDGFTRAISERIMELKQL